ncbi:MAG: hypothetical protein Q4A01_01110 [Coriobacteriales bacterium]|nr:hypothetical protein [Coriobacteriales bacterium]
MSKGIRVPGPFYLLAIVSLVAIIASFGAPLPWIPFAEVALDHPTAASSDGTYTAVATDQARKVLIVDGNNELYACIDYETFEAPLEIVTDVCVSNGRVYVAGMRYKPDSNVIALERVVAYGMNGAQQGIVYEQKGQGTKPGILSLDDQDGGVRA